MELQSGVASFFSFVRNLWGILPEEITALIWWSLMMLVLFSIIRSFVH